MSLPHVISLGTMLVEIMRINKDESFEQTGTFAGPYPSGDTPVFVNCVAKLGHSAGFVGAVGDDGFGRCILNRFAKHGVDARHVKVLPDRTTGIAFIAYAGDGSRSYIFHWRDAAAGQISPDYVHRSYFENAKWLHLTGGNLVITEASYAACLRALEYLPAGAKVSFDPNIREEWLATADIRSQWAPIVERSDFILPSEGEAALLLGKKDDRLACRLLAKRGKVVLSKRGAQGCVLVTGSQETEIPGFVVEEVDPTGAGDSFCAGFTVAMLDGYDVMKAARYATAVGALAVTRRGPMEGAPTREQVSELLAQRKRQS